MALKFRRGTTAQQSGSLAFGEPFVNTTLQTLLVGGNNGDITLATIGTGSTGVFGDISGSGLDITGNAEIHGNLVLGGNITIGDANTDTIALNADLSSSIIPDATNTFDLGSTTKVYRNVYATSISGAIAATNGVVSGSSQILGGSGIYSSSAQINGNIYSAGSSFTIQDIVLGAGTTRGKITTDGSKYISVMPTTNVESARFWANGNVTIQDAGTYVDNGYRLEVSGSTKVTDLTAAGFVSGEIRANNGVVSGSSQVTGILSSLNTYTGSLNNAIQLTGSTVSFLGNIVVYGTQSVINSQNVSISDNIIYLSPTASVDNDLGIVGHYNDGTYRHAGIFMDASDGHSWKVFNGLTDETSAQIDTAGNGFTLADFKAGAITGTSLNGTINATNGVVSGSSQVFSNISGDITIASNGVATIAANSVALGTDTTGDYVASLVAGTNITLSNNSGEGATPTIGLTNNAITIAGTSTSLGGTISAATIGNAIGAFSGSAQVAHDSTTGYSANRHIDHTAVSISAGSGLTGGGDISSTRTLSIATGGVTNGMLANSTISGISLGSNLATLTIGTGLSGTSYNGSGAVTIANTGVTSNVAGTGVTVSGATGAVTISIGQSVATNATPTFGNLTINGTITATGDITAYYTSDRRHKNNIQTIKSALLKVTKLNGVTWEWNDDVNEVTKSTPKTGLIAQEVQAVLPQVVTEREDGFLALDYSKMMGLMVEAIKEQQIQIDNLTAKVEELKRQRGL